MAKCGYDCFNCPYDDCKIEKASSAELREIRERDDRFFNTGKVIKQKPNRARKQARKYFF